MQRDLPLLCKLARVAEQIKQNLPQTHRVGFKWRQIVRTVGLEMVPVLLRQWTRCVNDFIDELRHIDPLQIEYELPCFDFGEIEELIDQVKKMKSCPMHSPKRFQCLFCTELRRPADQHVGEADNRI